MIPIGRSDGKTAVLFADGHVENVLPSYLEDMSLWIDAATTKRWYWEGGY
jgi:prepilin-type processing-associated H-X9-DG protein